MDAADDADAFNRIFDTLLADGMPKSERWVLH